MSDADDKFLDDLGTLWEETRGTIESFANKYLSAEAEEDEALRPRVGGHERQARRPRCGCSGSGA